jgi:spermidine synthase
MPFRQGWTPGATRFDSVPECVSARVDRTDEPTGPVSSTSTSSSSTPNTRTAWWAAMALMAASGFAGLGYQIVWTQQASLWLGHEAAAILAVVAAFFGGLALGAWVLGGRIEHSLRPWRWYIGCELLVAAWALVLTAGMPPMSRALLALTGVAPAAWWQWSLAFGGTFLLLLPATAAMGATLPAIERLTACWVVDRVPRGPKVPDAPGAPGGSGGTDAVPPRRSIAAHYASNTLGAVLGVLVTTFWLLPAIGLRLTAALCIGLNLACAAVAWYGLRPRRSTVCPSGPPGPPSPAPQATGHAAALPASARAGLAWLLFATGLLGIGYEVVVVRVLSQVAEDTVYTFALLLAVYLVGTALGAAAYQRHLTPTSPGSVEADTIAQRNRLLLVLACACAAGSLSLWAAPWVLAASRDLFGGGMVAALAAEAMLAVLAFLGPTLVMGALFSHLCAQAAAAGIGFGRAIGLNTAGAGAAPAVFGIGLAPWLGAQAVLGLLAAAYLLLRREATGAPVKRGLPVALALSAAVLAPPLRFVDLPPGGRVLSYQDGILAAVSVVEDAGGVARLRINNRQQEGSSSSLRADARQALLPMMLHDGPRRALFLGLGTGMTAASAAREPGVAIDAVELLPEVVAASASFTRAVADGSQLKALTVTVADARRFVRTTDTRYDVIVSDNFHPARSGSAALYTVEHFQAVRQRLDSHGIFCQWLPLHQLDLATLRSIVQSFRAVYPQSWAVLASNSLSTPVLGLVARRDDGHFTLAALRRRLARADWPGGPAAFGLEDEWALLGSFVAGPAALARFAGTAPANTDDRPLVAYRAPRITYAPDSEPVTRLFDLLAAFDQDRLAAREVIGRDADADDGQRLAAYWSARRGFLRVGRGVQPSADPQVMLQQVQQPLLQVLRLSPDFRPAYDPLLRMALALAPSQPDAARPLLAALMNVQPARPEAGALWRRLSAPAASRAPVP